MSSWSSTPCATLSARSAVAEWETKIVEKLPKDLEGSLPTIEQIEAEFAANVTPKRNARRQLHSCGRVASRFPLLGHGPDVIVAEQH
jgi:hypothetical protein